MHATQAADEVAPIAPDEDPAGHNVQALAPMVENDPAWHAVHCEESVAPKTDDQVPATQLEQDDAPNRE